MAMLAQGPYKKHEFKISGLKGLSDPQIEVHLGLYAGYVTNTNTLNERIQDLTKQGKVGSPDWVELTRRLGFEYDGMILHEYYFGQLKAGGAPMPSGGPLVQAIQQSFGSVDAWMSDFKAIGSMRGVGWALLYQDPMTGWLCSQWVTLHQDGHPAGFKPLLVLDVWEHAFMVDYKPAERSKYIDAFFQNLDWNVVEDRLQQAGAKRPIG
ncbi:MAG: Fe-Mn family superoxide dismutase [Dehalococcoidales bacterium]|nr:Fe-Mn family superoxide dismutase [Dehalococcoidales bacterium]